LCAEGWRRADGRRPGSPRIHQDAPETSVPKLSASLSLLFAEVAFLDRFAAAREAGFGIVEAQFPYEVPADALAARLRATGLALETFNVPGGDIAAGERGLTALPDRVEEFRAGVARGVDYAQAVGTRKLNCLAGIRQPGVAWETQYACLIDNLGWAASRVADHGITLHIEQVCQADVPGFLIDTLAVAERVLDDVGSENLLLQFDIYHVQRAQGDVASQIRRLIRRIGHVQVADSPGRGEPGTGELNIAFLLAELDRLGYDGRVGLEYRPTRPTLESLSWIEASGWSRDG
jgi:hydroxypyruvate isomerase